MSLWELKKIDNDESIASFNLQITEFNITVSNSKILKKDELPEVVLKGVEKYEEKENFQEYLDAIFLSFISQRATKRTGQDLDKYISVRLNLCDDIYMQGRLNGYQYTAAAISYFISIYDDYCVIPQNTELLYYGFTNDYLNNIFVIPHKIKLSKYDIDVSYETNRKIAFCQKIKNPLKTITYTDTLYSDSIAFVYYENGHFYLWEDYKIEMIN